MLLDARICAQMAELDDATLAALVAGIRARREVTLSRFCYANISGRSRRSVDTEMAASITEKGHARYNVQPARYPVDAWHRLFKHCAENSHGRP
jgi:hypothetical protein